MIIDIILYSILGIITFFVARHYMYIASLYDQKMECLENLVKLSEETDKEKDEYIDMIHHYYILFKVFIDINDFTDDFNKFISCLDSDKEISIELAKEIMSNKVTIEMYNKLRKELGYEEDINIDE